MRDREFESGGGGAGKRKYEAGRKEEASRKEEGCESKEDLWE